MSALQKLIFAGVAAALVSVPAAATERIGRLAADPHVTASQGDCRGAGCEAETMPAYCVADDVCGHALPGSALVRYDALMDATAPR